MTLKINPAKVLTILLVSIVILILLHLTFTHLAATSGNENFYGILPVFHIDAEMNIPTLFSSVNLLLSGLLLFIIGQLHKSAHQKYLAWMILAAIFVGLGMDETAMIHEKIGSKVHDVYNTTGYLRFSWVIPYGIFSIVLLVMYSRFLFNLPRRFMWLFLLSGGVFVSGALGLEMMTAKINQFQATMADQIGTQQVIEEILEMTGIALFIYTLLSYIETIFPESSLSVGRESSAQHNKEAKELSNQHSAPRAAL